eukprot:scaffold779_cov205-Alexandrium_tamarense.AAC.25
MESVGGLSDNTSYLIEYIELFTIHGRDRKFVNARRSATIIISFGLNLIKLYPIKCPNTVND